MNLRAGKHTRKWTISVRRASQGTKRGRLLTAITAAGLGSGLVALGSVTTTAPALASAQPHSVTYRAIDGTDANNSATETVTTTPAASPCSDPVRVQLGGHSVSSGMVTVEYSILGCVGTDRLHIHENLLTEPRAGSDPVHQVNYDFDIGKDSSTHQSVPLLDSADGKCWVQVDYSTARERKGFFVRTATCATPTSSTPAPPTSSTPAQVTSSKPAPASTSAAVAAASASRSAPPSAVSQLGPIPETGYTGTIVAARSHHPFWWATIVGGALLVAGLAGAIRSFVDRRGATQ